MTPVPTIEGILTDAKDPSMVRLCVAGARMGPLRRDDAIRLGAREGSRWTKALATHVKALACDVACRADALKRLGHRDLSQTLLMHRLTRKWGEPAASRVVASLVRDGWVNDAAYARSRVEALQRVSPMSAEGLQQRLQEEGVAESLAHSVANTSFDPAAVHRTVRAWKKQRRSALWISKRLSQRGFDMDTIASALQRAGIACDFDST